MQTVLRTLERVIETDVPVLLQGESGTGKELLAKAIHYNGPRKSAPLVTINCGALPETLLESELFGHVRGAFTGASDDREGLFVAAHGGTIFLDELGEMPAAMQVKLLRVLQEQEVRPVGGKRTRRVDVRVLSATNRKLREEVSRGRFREDLFYRIAVIEIAVPPLRERLDDLPELARHLLISASERMQRPPAKLTAGAMRSLLDHRWPGNVRELDNVLTKALLMSDNDTITVADLPLSPRGSSQSREQFEAERGAALLAILRETNWNISATARKMGISRPTVYRKMRQLGIKPS